MGGVPGRRPRSQGRGLRRRHRRLPAQRRRAAPRPVRPERLAALHLRLRPAHRDRDRHRHPGGAGGPRVLERPRSGGPRRHRRRLHHRLQHQARRRHLRHLPGCRLGPGLPRRALRRGRGRRGACRPHAAVGPGEPRADHLGRVDLRGDHPGRQPRARRRGRHGHLRQRGGVEDRHRGGRPLPAVAPHPRVGLLRRPRVPLLRRPADQQGGLPPRGRRLHGLHLRALPALRLRPADPARLRDGPGRERPGRDAPGLPRVDHRLRDEPGVGDGSSSPPSRSCSSGSWSSRSPTRSG